MNYKAGKTYLYLANNIQIRVTYFGKFKKNIYKFLVREKLYDNKIVTFTSTSFELTAKEVNKYIFEENEIINDLLSP